MKIENIKNYLNEKITNSWYKNSEIDYGISGKFLDCETIGNDLKIIWEEMGEQLQNTAQSRYITSGWKKHSRTCSGSVMPAWAVPTP